MYILMQEICKWAGTNPSKRNFVEGEKIVKAGHIVKIGKTFDEGSDANMRILAFCLQTSSLKEKPHEIRGEISYDGAIESMVCSCKAGLGEKCKHIVGTLLQCHTIDFDDLPTISCTDVKCTWKENHNKVLKNYEAWPILHHSCFNTNKKLKIYNVSENLLMKLKSIIEEDVPDSAYTKHVIERHEPITADHFKVFSVTSSEKHAMELIFLHQTSALMSLLAASNSDLQLKPCCLKKFEALNGNVLKICEDTKVCRAIWEQERRCRFTGTTCYGLYTHTKSRTPNWEKKCKSHLYPKKFKSKYTEYGRNTEPEARQVFMEKTGKTVHETGLVVSKQNPWLAVSPDGVVFENGKPSEVLEIKCPYKGASMSVNEAMEQEFKKCLEKRDGKYCLKKNTLITPKCNLTWLY